MPGSEFINGGKDMLIQSDKTGWNHLYLYGADGTFKNAITSGNTG
jgi:dipeptidyl-peptidase 4